MTQRTCNIIGCCKGTLNPEISSRIERIKMYISEECAYPIECYTDRDINSILVSAACDYIDTCDKPSAFLRNILEDIPRDLTLAEILCSVFALVRVKGHDGYVNGFKEEFLDNQKENYEVVYYENNRNCKQNRQTKQTFNYCQR